MTVGSCDLLARLWGMRFINSDPHPPRNIREKWFRHCNVSHRGYDKCPSSPFFWHDSFPWYLAPVCCDGASLNRKYSNSVTQWLLVNTLHTHTQAHTIELQHLWCTKLFWPSPLVSVRILFEWKGCQILVPGSHSGEWNSTHVAFLYSRRNHRVIRQKSRPGPLMSKLWVTAAGKSPTMRKKHGEEDEPSFSGPQRQGSYE